MQQTTEANGHTNRQPGPTPSRASGTIRSWLLIAIGLAIPCLLLVATLTWHHFHDKGYYGSTENNMKQLGLACIMYSDDSQGGRFPQLAPNEAIWAPDLEELFPEYLTRPITLVSREHPDYKAIAACLDAVLNRPNPDLVTASGLVGLSFAYLGYVVGNEAEFRTLCDARQQTPAGHTESLDDTEDIYRLRTEGIRADDPRLESTDHPSVRRMRDIPVIVEIAHWKYKKSVATFPGAEVLYKDGHVEFVKLGNFPVVPEVMDVLSGLADGLPAKSTPVESEAATAPYP